MGEPISSTASAAIPVTSPFFLHSSDQPSTPLVTILLDGDNFPTWHRSMLMALEAKNKLPFIDGSLPKPDTDSPDLPLWIRCNSMVRSWIVHSTVSSIAHSIVWLDTTLAVWIDLHERFSPKNAPRIFEIRQALSTYVQGTDSITAYYTIIKGYRDELLSYRDLPACTCCTLSSLYTLLETDSPMDFFQGLNDSYAAVHSQILRMEPLPTMTKAYSLLL
ncbi:uncharacterized protein LOC122638746 [Telopea speciosissima]|uniref:uncharacterized protein LOC122638746 n=1 Tax=Telopea speciosissima TaxID=54955 RepID=UPI001CC6AAC1|nr:uncharacterized protein LOC122638746 [Telopea speciosissima]